MQSRLCPGCYSGLTPARLGPANLDACLRCGSAWFDRAGLAMVIQAGPDVLRRLSEKLQASIPGEEPLPVAQPACPACFSKLAAVEYPHVPSVRMCACSYCQGFWVGWRTLRSLADALGGAAPTPAAARPTSTPIIPGYPAPGSLPPATAYSQPPYAATPGHAHPVPPPGLTPPSPPPAPAPPTARANPQPVLVREACPKCDQPNPSTAAVCWACGQMLRGKAGGSCPRCDGVMHQLKEGDAELSACESCGGVWLGPAKMSVLLCQPSATQDLILKQIARLRVGQSRRFNAAPACLNCKQLMLVTRVGALSQRPVRMCTRCTTYFLDFGILDEIVMRDRR